jgi:hypothetical protein
MREIVLSAYALCSRSWLGEDGAEQHRRLVNTILPPMTHNRAVTTRPAGAPLVSWTLRGSQKVMPIPTLRPRELMVIRRERIAADCPLAFG